MSANKKYNFNQSDQRYQAALFVVRHRPDLATDEDRALYEHALELGDGSTIGKQARLVRSVKEAAAKRIAARQERRLKKEKKRQEEGK